MNELTAKFDDNLLDDGLKLFFTIVKAETGKVLRILSRLLSKLRRFLESVFQKCWHGCREKIVCYSFKKY